MDAVGANLFATIRCVSTFLMPENPMIPTVHELAHIVPTTTVGERWLEVIRCGPQVGPPAGLVHDPLMATDSSAKSILVKSVARSRPSQMHAVYCC